MPVKVFLKQILDKFYCRSEMSKKHLLTVLMISIIIRQALFAFELQSGKIQSRYTLQITYNGKVPPTFANHLVIRPYLPVKTVQIDSPLIQITTSQPFELTEHYYLDSGSEKSLFLLPDGILDSLFSDKKLGYEIKDGKIFFRLFAPRAKWVHLIVFDHYDDRTGKEFFMQQDTQGVWEVQLFYPNQFRFYGYRLWGPAGEGEMFDSTLVLADPYSPAVVTQNRYTHPAKTHIISENQFDWQGDNWQEIAWNDLIIYEMHIRDMTAHPSTSLKDESQAGGYLGLIQPDQKGGLPYLISLGINAVELLPAQDFGNLEVPFKDPTAPVYNTWNPYERNHWGYMTSYFFAPESYYASRGNMLPAQYNGTDAQQIDEFKTMVKTLHQNRIAVLMDVVYNHVSQYDYNPLKYIDKFYYFRLNDDCSFTSVSGCGNDLRTERPMTRRLIVDSVIHWLREYHIDGFRFDLAHLIDWKTIDCIREEAQKIHPGVILIAEPWGGGYNPDKFSDHQWASWNDQIRNGVKGQNPYDGLGFIFGKWQGENSRKSLQRFVQGSLRTMGGQYLKSDHSINYLESHDDYTLGDFIRIGLKDVSAQDKISDLDKHIKLTATQMKINKLAALFLFVSQGPVMIHAGQEFARSKVIAPTSAPDPDVGKIDHNSYNKDNETNWLNYTHADLNHELLDYYRQLIHVRLEHEAFRYSQPEDFRFFHTVDSLFLAFQINYKKSKYIVLLNGNNRKEQKFSMPGGKWKILVNPQGITSQPKTMVRGNTITLSPSSGMILMQ